MRRSLTMVMLGWPIGATIASRTFYRFGLWRLLLIGEFPAFDATTAGIEEAVVGHWNKFHFAFVPADVPGPRRTPLHLRVSHWAELDLPKNILLRNIDGILAP